MSTRYAIHKPDSSMENVCRVAWYTCMHACMCMTDCICVPLAFVTRCQSHSIHTHTHTHTCMHTHTHTCMQLSAPPVTESMIYMMYSPHVHMYIGCLLACLHYVALLCIQLNYMVVSGQCFFCLVCGPLVTH